MNLGLFRTIIRRGKELRPVWSPAVNFPIQTQINPFLVPANDEIAGEMPRPDACVSLFVIPLAYS